MRICPGFRAIFSLVFLLLPLEAFAQTSLSEIVPRIKKELVAIRSAERPERQGQNYDPYYYFFGEPLAAGQGTFPLGTGFVLPDGKHVATTARSLENLNAVEILADGGKVSKATVVGIDRNLDLAILALEGGKSKAFSGIDFGDSKSMRVGDALYLFGRSVKFVMLRTDLSSTDTVEGTYGRHWLIDQPTTPAVAGGPLVDTRGRVVGMAVYNPRGPAQFGTVLPANLILASAKDLIKSGKPNRAWLGIVPRAKPNLDDLDHIHGADVKSGILVENLIVDGPAAKSGLRISDIILSINGKAVTSLQDLFALLDRSKAGETLPMKIFRAGKGVMELRIQLGELPNARELPNTENLL